MYKLQQQSYPDPKKQAQPASPHQDSDEENHSPRNTNYPASATPQPSTTTPHQHHDTPTSSTTDTASPRPFDDDVANALYTHWLFVCSCLQKAHAFFLNPETTPETRILLAPYLQQQDEEELDLRRAWNQRTRGPDPQLSA
jgi:BRCT domain type II-containing protein